MQPSRHQAFLCKDLGALKCVPPKPRFGGVLFVLPGPGFTTLVVQETLEAQY